MLGGRPGAPGQRGWAVGLRSSDDFAWSGLKPADCLLRSCEITFGVWEGNVSPEGCACGGTRARSRCQVPVELAPRGSGRLRLGWGVGGGAYGSPWGRIGAGGDGRPCLCV